MFVAASFADEIGFQGLQTLRADGNVAVEQNGFVYESIYLDMGHGNKSRVEVSCRAPSGALAPEVARHERSTPRFLPTW